ncbi:MAG: outer membrane lipoprotein-sorting protein [Spirochaetales bacterium]|nr:outer membrane lipoprotein-sorting protein [Spirochaetales bacterium]
MKYIVKILITVALLVIFTMPLLFSEEEDALSIIRKMEEMNQTKSSKTEISMLIYPDVYNKDDYRQLKVLSYSKGDEDSCMVFLSPKTIKGLSILSKGGEQWVFFPSTGRVRKIAGQSKNKSVQGVGGDFTYEDLGGGNLHEKYTFTITESTKDNWVIQGNPKDKDSSYTKIIVIVNKENYLMEKVEYYTEEDGHSKDLIMKEYKMIGGRLMPSKMIMANLSKESMTVIITHAAEYDIEIDEKYFNPTRFYK